MPNQETQLEIKQRGLATQEPSVGALIQSVIASGVTKDNVEVLEKMLAMKERMDAKAAEREFATAFVQLQKELPSIPGARPIPDRNGKVKFHYANFDDIDTIVRPICLKNGFTYAFHEGGIDNGRVTVIMTLQHCGGFSRQIPYSVRIGGGPPGANESQADVSGHSYAQRGAIESGLSLRMIGGREDARAEGAAITPGEAAELKRRVLACKANESQFLAVAAASDYESIPSEKLELLQDMLTRRESKVGKKETPHAEEQDADGNFKF